jgi:hypothetical protein
MAQFHETYMGRKFFDHDVPKIIENMGKLAQEQATANKLKARELRIREAELKAAHGVVLKEEGVADSEFR